MGSSAPGCEGPTQQSGLWARLDPLEKSIELDTELRQKYCQMDLEGGRSPSGSLSGSPVSPDPRTTPGPEQVFNTDLMNIVALSDHLPWLLSTPHIVMEVV